MSDNQLFEHMLASLGWITDGTALGVDYPKRSRQQVLEVHRSILEAIEQRDPALAEQRMREHIESYVATSSATTSSCSTSSCAGRTSGHEHGRRSRTP